MTASDCGVEAISLADSGLCSDASPVPKSAYESPAQDPGLETFEYVESGVSMGNGGIEAFEYVDSGVSMGNGGYECLALLFECSYHLGTSIALLPLLLLLSSFTSFLLSCSEFK